MITKECLRTLLTSPLALRGCAALGFLVLDGAGWCTGRPPCREPSVGEQVAGVMHLELFRENGLECAIEIIQPPDPFTLSILDVL